MLSILSPSNIFRMTRLAILHCLAIVATSTRERTYLVLIQSHWKSFPCSTQGKTNGMNILSSSTAMFWEKRHVEEPPRGF
jgi:hypothetical protein